MMDLSDPSITGITEGDTEDECIIHYAGPSNVTIKEPWEEIYKIWCYIKNKKNNA